MRIAALQREPRAKWTCRRLLESLKSFNRSLKSEFIRVSTLIAPVGFDKLPGGVEDGSVSLPLPVFDIERAIELVDRTEPLHYGPVWRWGGGRFDCHLSPTSPPTSLARASRSARHQVVPISSSKL